MPKFIAIAQVSRPDFIVNVDDIEFVAPSILDHTVSIIHLKSGTSHGVNTSVTDIMEALNKAVRNG